MVYLIIVDFIEVIKINNCFFFFDIIWKRRVVVGKFVVGVVVVLNSDLFWFIVSLFVFLIFCVNRL